MFPLRLRVVPLTHGTLFSFQVNKDGIFIFLCPVELALLAMDQGMSHHAPASFALWSTPATRDQCSAAPIAPIQPPARRSFAMPVLRLESLNQTAHIFAFTVSNTPYESHE